MSVGQSRWATLPAFLTTVKQRPGKRLKFHYPGDKAVANILWQLFIFLQLLEKDAAERGKGTDITQVPLTIQMC